MKTNTTIRPNYTFFVDEVTTHPVVSVFYKDHLVATLFYSVAQGKITTVDFESQHEDLPFNPIKVTSNLLSFYLEPIEKWLSEITQ